MSLFDDLKGEVEKGLLGGNKGIPMGFEKLNKYIGIRKSIYILIGGNTGSGKTAFVDDAFILNPLDWYISKKNDTNIKLQIVYRSMERSRVYKIAKWLSRKIFLDTGFVIPVGTLLGWTGTMTESEQKLFYEYEWYTQKIEEVVTIIDGAENPVGIAKNLKTLAESQGEIIDLDKYNKKYMPNDNNLVTIVVIDHIGLLKTTKDYPTKKQAIDKLSDDLRFARDFYGYTIVAVSQFNRSISNPIRLKNGDVEPQLEDFAESSQTQNDADIILALFDPIRYKVADPSGYDLARLKDSFGAKYYRSIRLIKNSYGEDDLRLGLAFMGQIGLFKELKRSKDMTVVDYDSVTDKSYFLTKKKY
jgi:hypothetical protein